MYSERLFWLGAGLGRSLGHGGPFRRTSWFLSSLPIWLDGRADGPRAGAAPHQPQHGRLRPRSSARRDPRPRGDAPGPGPRRALPRRGPPLSALRPDLADLRRRPRGRRSTAASRATGGRWPGCEGPRSRPTRSGPSRRPSAGPERRPGCDSPGSRTWRWRRASPGCRRGDERPGRAAQRRWSLRGLTDEGDEAWLIRGVSRKLYRCPGCHGEIEIGSEHTIVQYVHRLGGTEHHHWHRRCAEELLVPDPARLEAGAGRESPRRASSRRAGGAVGDGAGARDAAGRGANWAPLRADRPHLLRAGRGRCCRSRLLVFVPLGLIHAIPVHADLRSNSSGGGARLLGVAIAILALAGDRADRRGLLHRGGGDRAHPPPRRESRQACARSRAWSATAG